MQAIIKDIWSVDLDSEENWVGITTNGITRKDGALVMGRGTAKQAKDRFPGIDRIIGLRVTSKGNKCIFLPQFQLFTFPVKHHWKDVASLSLIAESARQLNAVAIDFPNEIFYLPRPGCGNGQLSWSEVEPVMRNLPDNVICVTNDAISGIKKK